MEPGAHVREHLIGVYRPGEKVPGPRVDRFHGGGPRAERQCRSGAARGARSTDWPMMQTKWRQGLRAIRLPKWALLRDPRVSHQEDTTTPRGWKHVSCQS